MILSGNQSGRQALSGARNLELADLHPSPITVSRSGLQAHITRHSAGGSLSRNLSLVSELAQRSPVRAITRNFNLSVIDHVASLRSTTALADMHQTNLLLATKIKLEIRARLWGRVRPVESVLPAINRISGHVALPSAHSGRSLGHLQGGPALSGSQGSPLIPSLGGIVHESVKDAVAHRSRNRSGLNRKVRIHIIHAGRKRALLGGLHRHQGASGLLPIIGANSQINIHSRLAGLSPITGRLQPRLNVIVKTFRFHLGKQLRGLLDQLQTCTQSSGSGLNSGRIAAS